MKILVVDDELDICEILQYNLETEGFEVTTACSAEEALELPLHDYSLILLDVMMGEMSGFQMARRLKENPTTAHIPIIFIAIETIETIETLETTKTIMPARHIKDWPLPARRPSFAVKKADLYHP